MTKSKIIRQLANDEISLETALKRLMIISTDIGNKDLYSWSIKELNGYNESDVVPQYRILESNYILYTGINGSFQVNKQPLPITYFPENAQENIRVNKIRHGVGTLTYFSGNEDGDIIIDLTRYAGHIFKTSGIQCVSIKQQFSKAEFLQILDRIKVLLLEIYIKLDNTLGCLDELDIEPDKEKQNELETMNDNISSLIYCDGKGAEL